MTVGLRFLFYKRELKWPFESGHDVHTFNLIKALQAAGDDIGLVTTYPLPERAVEALPLALRCVLSDGHRSSEPVQLAGWQERFRSYWGIPVSHLTHLRDLSRDF